MKVGVIYYNTVYEKTGAGKIVRTFLDEEGFFKANGIDEINIFSLENIVSSSTNNSANIIKTKLRKIVSKVLHYFYLSTCIHINYAFFRLGKKAVEEYVTKSMFDEDLLVFHEIFSCNAYLTYCKRSNQLHKDYILVEHNNGEPLKMLKIYFPKIIGKKYEKYLERICDECENSAKFVVLVSESSKNTFIKRRKDLKKRAVAIPNGIANTFQTPKVRDYKTIRLVTVGTVNERKNQIEIIKALGSIREMDIHLTVVGAGNKLDECERMVKQLGISDKVAFLGARNDIDEILDKENLFIMTSLDEGLPIAGIEALRSGLPLILTDVGGNKELIKDNGYLIDLNNVNLAEFLKNLFENKEALKKMGEKSYLLFLEKYSLEIMVKKYVELFKEITKAQEVR